MKNTKLFLSAVLVFTVLSCQQDPILNESENANLKAATSGFQLSSEAETLEAAMQVNSYVIGRLARYNSAFRSEITTRVNLSSTNIINLDELLSNISSQLYDAYEQEVEFIYNCCPDPGDDEEIPPPPPPGGMGDGNDPPQLLISYLLNQHCIEMHFPNGFDYSGWLPELTTTAHPMNSDDDNVGYVRFYNPQEIAPEVFSTTDLVTVDQTYVNNNDNVIITRPYRLGPLEANCQYSEYNGIDFEDFPDQ